MSPKIYNNKEAIIKEKMASFDYDWTLVNPKDGKTFPSSIDDWEWFSPTVPKIITKYYDYLYSHWEACVSQGIEYKSKTYHRRQMVLRKN